MSAEKLILICDVNIKKQGHYIGYNQYIINNFNKIEATNPGTRYIFLYNDEAKKLLTFPSQAIDRVFFLPYKSSEDNFQNRIKVFRLIQKFIINHQVNHMIFMDLDRYQLAIALTKSSCTISGILFRPHHRITSSNKNFISETKTSIKKIKKIVSEKLILCNQQISHIFILNDTEGVNFLNRKYNTNVYKYLTDPIFSYISNDTQSKTERENNNKPYTFLIFGAINERKNITNIIKAYEQLNLPVTSKLLIVGPGESTYLEYLRNLTGSLQTIDNKHKFIEIKNEFVSNEEMDKYFSESDTCLLVYKNFFGSSGLLGRAALHKVKVIGPNVGLLCEMIDSNKIGMICDPENCEEIAKSLSNIQKLCILPEAFEKYYKEYSPEKFIQTLLTAYS